MMTSSELAQLLGRTGTMPHDGLTVAVRILDAREVFGRTDVLVESLPGVSRWVDAARVTLEGEGA